MRRTLSLLLVLVPVLATLPGYRDGTVYGATHPDRTRQFLTADRCVACHNGLKTGSGEDVSIGLEWRASVMANSARDPYWQGSVRRESIDHAESSGEIEDECANCHMMEQHMMDKAGGQKTSVFSRLPLQGRRRDNRFAEDGVSCSVCHQIERTGLETSEAFNGNVVVADPTNPDHRYEYGPFVVDAGHRRVMQSSTAGFVPQPGPQVRDPALCGSCHTLYTVARGPGGKALGRFAEQMPYLEWQHSDYRVKQTCQQCHMPEVSEPIAVAVHGPKRTGLHQHVFLGGNFLLQQMLNDHRKELDVAASPEGLEAAVNRTSKFLSTQSARLELKDLERNGADLSFAVRVVNLTGHKLPTAYPSRRAWLCVTVSDRDGNAIFESGILNPDGSIRGNENDADPRKFEPHYREITRADQVEIFEPILKDSDGRVTTGLLSAVGYLKDNRILPAGFDKQSARDDVAVAGAAREDDGFIGGSATVRYRVKTEQPGPYRIRVQLWYQPVGFRWAHNLAPYQAGEPQRFVGYYSQASKKSALVIAEVSSTY